MGSFWGQRREAELGREVFGLASRLATYVQRWGRDGDRAVAAYPITYARRLINCRGVAAAISRCLQKYRRYLSAEMRCGRRKGGKIEEEALGETRRVEAGGER